MTTITPSEIARHARAELEVIIASLNGAELVRMLELARRLMAAPSTPSGARRTLDAT